MTTTQTRNSDTMSGAQVREARIWLGLSQQGLALAVNVGEGRTVRRWENEESDVPGPVALLLELARRHESVRAELVERGFR